MGIDNIIFGVVLLAALAFFGYNLGAIIQLIRGGKPYRPAAPLGFRFRSMLRYAFGQQKMFDRPIVGLLHFFVYAGFIIINLEMLEIVIDGLTGAHRIFLSFLSPSTYSVFISIFEVLAVLVIVSCVIFLVRRNVLKIPRFHSPEMTRWPKLDANIILVTEIALMLAFLLMNASDRLLQLKGVSGYHPTGDFLVSHMLMPMLSSFSADQLVFLERFSWWGHIIGVLAFLNYIPYSKHLHIFLAFPNTYYMSDKPKGYFPSIPEITAEVKYMLNPEGPEPPISEEPPLFGARDVYDLTWKNLLDAFTCTECGRCTSECPANLTGKRLSPRKIMMDTRDRLEALRLRPDAESHTLFPNYITAEEVLACNTCMACVEVCPVGINPLDIILKIRRHMVTDEGKAPSEWNLMFGNIENNGAPWQFSPDDRAQWTALV